MGNFAAGLMGDSPADAAFDSRQDANKQIRRNKIDYNDYLKMIQGKIEGSGYDFFAPQTTTQTGHSETRATFGEEAQPLVDKLSAMYKTRLESPTGLPEGYEGAALRGINDAYEGARVAANNTAARRGLSAEQAVSIGTPIEAARAGKIADVANQMPLLGRQLQNEDMAAAQGFSDMLKGSVTDSSGSTTAPPNIGDYLTYLGMLKPYERPVLIKGADAYDQSNQWTSLITSLIGALATK